ncbi:hypothetical protein DT603_02875 [Pseudoxanthomonas gei]|uniref:Secreted protein n=1 Tax=Pseudoxanthomonas gei TaxID=1383030 RepID=A0ABX0AB47_9GAMM|nr:hypothetical protein [Pseudoxanthomonas gei]NDK37780.1 hypothetical protein [Pseudoxanthomonas gei]
MIKSLYLLAALLGLPAAALAQQAPSRCPPLPASSGLQWTEKVGNGFLACKALSADNRQSLNVMLTSRDPDLHLSRSQRAEAGRFSGESLHWYVPELAGSQDAAASRRITVVKLGKDQYAQVWVDAASAEDLARLQTLAGQLDASAGASYLVSGQ